MTYLVRLRELRVHERHRRGILLCSKSILAFGVLACECCSFTRALLRLELRRARLGPSGEPRRLL